MINDEVKNQLEAKKLILNIPTKYEQNYEITKYELFQRIKLLA